VSRKKEPDISASAAVGLLAGCAALLLGSASSGAADPPRLYDSGPARGAGFIRIANVSNGIVSITPAGRARIDISAQDALRVTHFEAITPGKIAASIRAGNQSRKLNVAIAANELVTVAIGVAVNGSIAMTVFRETPKDFNALRSSLALFGVDKTCANARLVADKNTVVIAGVAPGSLGRKTVNPVKATLAVFCASESRGLPAELGQLEAGERYSVLIFAAQGEARRVLALRDEMAVTRD